MKSISSATPDQPQHLFQHGFVHVVYFWLKPDLPAEQIRRFESELQRLVDESAHAVTGHVGRPAGTQREVVDNSYDYCLIVTFADEAGHQAYQDEPPHDRFREVAAELADRVQIFDSKGVSAGR